MFKIKSRSELNFHCKILQDDLAEIEARMYAQVYHDTSVEPTPDATEILPYNFNKQSNKRYWQKSKNLSTQRENFVRILYANFVKFY